MANLKISQLTATTTNTIGSWVVVNNSGETTTNKSELKDVLGLTNGTAPDSMRSGDLLSASGGTASGSSSIALGNGASALNDASIAIGKQAYAARERDIAIGFGANTDLAESEDGIAIGTGARVVRDYGIAIGYDAIALTDGIAIGRSTRPIGDTCIAIGRQNVSAGNRGYAIGASIFCDRDDAGAIGSSVYVDGARSIAIGANLSIGASGSCEDSVNIGSDIDIVGNVHKQIAIGYQANTEGTGAINISSGGLNVNSDYGLNIGGTGNTYAGGTVKFGNGNIRIGGFNDSINLTPGSFNTFIGGRNNQINSVGGGGTNNVYLGLSGRTIPVNTNNRTFVENLTVLGSITQGFTTYTGTTVDIDISSVGYAEVSALSSGSTYNIKVLPAPNNIGDTLTIFVEYQDGATVNFISAGGGLSEWKWDKSVYGGSAPSFSATTGNVSRSIIVVNTWDGNDIWEVSRSMNME